MDPVLIFTDTRRIEEEIDKLDDSIVFFQSLYNSFLAIEVTPTLQDLSNLIQVKGNHPEKAKARVIDFVAEKYLDKAGEPTFNGVPIQRSKLKEMLSLPDVSSVVAALEGINSFNNSGFRINLMTLAEDVITKNADANDLITTEFTYYTKNDRSAQFVTQINAVITALNNWQTSYMNDLGFSHPFQHEESPIPGIVVKNKVYMPDLNFIQRQEARWS